MHSLLDKLLLKIFKQFFLLVILFIVSCADRSEQANKNFLKKYNKNVQDINYRREQANPESDVKNITMASSPPSASSQIIAPPPNTRMQLPQDMFIISYNLYNFPASYGKVKLSFDDIIIPDIDIFGVKTRLGEKNYQLVDNKILQKNIDLINQLETKEDREISLELIKQEKKARRNNINKGDAKL